MVVENEAGSLAKHMLVGHPVEGSLAGGAIVIGAVIWPKRWPVVVGVVLAATYGLAWLQRRGFEEK